MSRKSLLLTFAWLSIISSCNSPDKGGKLQHVDPYIGTVSFLLEPTHPTMHLPNSMVRVYPVRKDQLADQIDYFPLSMHSYRTGNIFSVMPVVKGETAAVPAVYEMEQVSPHYYRVTLDEPQINLEYTPSHRSGYFRFTSPSGGINLCTGIVNDGSLNLHQGVLTGTEEFRGMKAYVYAEFGSEVSGAGNGTQALVISSSADVLEMRYGISFISVDQAKENLRREIPHWDFDGTCDRAQQQWEKVLGQIDVEGGSEADKRVFYTALYRTYERMVDINEYGRYYSAYDGTVHEDDQPFFVDNWIWDSYVAQEPLHMILDPDKEALKISSYIKMYEQSGWMPSFALVFGDDPRMTGNHAAAWMCDAWFKGVRGFDLAKGYEGIRKNSTEGTLLPWRSGPATILDEFYAQHGYFPALAPGEKESIPQVDDFEKRQSVAVTLQQSYDDWCISRLAAELGLGDDECFFGKRAGNYKHVFRSEKGFMWPKDSAGNWIEPFDPVISGGLGGRQYFTENNAYTYNWDVKHDLYALFELMGGRQKAEEKLDGLFRQDPQRSKYNYYSVFPDATGLVGQFVMGNEPSFHIPYLYNYLGAPWKTQKRIRNLIETWFVDNMFGMPGDEDGGGMSAFVVFSMMGFYPVTPGLPVYAIGSPSFNEVSIQLPSGRRFTVKAAGNSPTAKYIRSARLNGEEWNKAWLTHEQIIRGGTLELVMSETPNKEWGTSDLPALK